MQSELLPEKSIQQSVKNTKKKKSSLVSYYVLFDILNMFFSMKYVMVDLLNNAIDIGRNLEPTFLQSD